MLVSSHFVDDPDFFVGVFLIFEFYDRSGQQIGVTGDGAEKRNDGREGRFEEVEGGLFEFLYLQITKFKSRILHTLSFQEN